MYTESAVSFAEKNVNVRELELLPNFLNPRTVCNKFLVNHIRLIPLRLSYLVVIQSWYGVVLLSTFVQLVSGIFYYMTETIIVYYYWHSL